MNIALCQESEVVNRFVPLGSSLCEKIENDPIRSDSRSKVVSEVDLLKDYKRKQMKRRQATRLRKENIYPQWLTAVF